jgi:hypothetical protein
MNCMHCGEPLLPDEAVPAESRVLPAGAGVNYHRECLVRMVAGSAAHQLRECTCFGGTREDPPGMTARQAAILAFDTFGMLERGRRLSFGKTVRSRREAKGIILRKFAQAVGITCTYLSKIERGDLIPPSEETIRAIASALGEDGDKFVMLAWKEDPLL